MNNSRNSSSVTETRQEPTDVCQEEEEEDEIVKGGLKDVFGRTYRSALATKSLDYQLHNHLLNNYYSAMAAQSPTTEIIEEFPSDIEDCDQNYDDESSPHLSFENPNYRGNNPELGLSEDHLNCNTLYEELKQVRIRKMMIPTSPSRRKVYAELDINSMGVDLEAGPITELDNNKKKTIEDNHLFLDAEIESQKLVESETEKDMLSSPNKVKRRPKKNVKNESESLPPGWERHEDSDGSYFWHVKSGTIQRERPPNEFEKGDETEDSSSKIVRNIRSSKIFDEDFPVKQSPAIKKIPKSCTSSSIADMAKISFEPEKNDKKEVSSNGDSSWKRRSLPLSSVESGKIMQVTVRSLGWVELAEEELTPENSSKAVNRCIIQLSSPLVSGTKEPSGQWGGGKELSLILDERSLKLYNEEEDVLLNSQPIHTIRVWGVGRDNGRDFAYVARDRHTRRHLCHVFRCDKPARSIANALRDICKKILIERSLAQSSSKLSTPSSGGGGILSSEKGKQRTSDRVRPTSLGAKLQTKSVPAPESFPTPMEEPRKSIKAWYLGEATVPKPCGMDVINDTIDDFVGNIPRSEWKTIMVSVAPSTVSVSFMNGQDPLECRVRFLSFLGIGTNPQQCAFIVHTAQDTFVCHAFHCEPTAGPLCKTIEAACKLRYQKCLDARPQGLSKPVLEDGNGKSIGATIKNMFGSLTAKARGSPQDVT